MPTAIICHYQNREITITEALEIRGNRKLPNGTFQCSHCGFSVRPHREGGNKSAHFEHLERNPECPHSHPFNRAAYVPPEYYELEDPKAIEGYEIDRNILTYKRNPEMAQRCKERDNFTCRACSFKLELHGKHIVECHHTIMVSGGEREISLSELITLCPTCHRITHTRKIPYSLAELKSIVCNL